MMARTVRIALLLFILLVVAQSAWKARARTVDWKETLRVVVYPINSDGSAAADAYIGSLRRSAFEPLAAFMRDEARRYGLPLRDPVEVDLASRVTARPPVPPVAGGAFDIARWSLQMRWWAWRHDDYDGPRPHVRVFMLYHAPLEGRALAHSIGLRAGMMVIANAFAGTHDEGGNNVVVAHELMHTFGATDKYDTAGNLPLFPEGYADPQADPRYPQTRAEIMGGRIPLSPREAEIPRSLDQVLIGPATAREINWLK